MLRKNRVSYESYLRSHTFAVPAWVLPWKQGPKAAGLLLQPCSPSLPYFHLTLFLLLSPHCYNSSCILFVAPIPPSCPQGLTPSEDMQPAAVCCTQISSISLVYDLEEQQEILNPLSTSLEKPSPKLLPFENEVGITQIMPYFATAEFW